MKTKILCLMVWLNSSTAFANLPLKDWPSDCGKEPVSKVPGRTQVYPANKIVVFSKKYKITPTNKAILSYSFTLNPGFQFKLGGKLPGLAGGAATTGCRAIESNGWSLRFMWRQHGKMVTYAYHQDRRDPCGDDWSFVPETYLEVGKKYHVTQLVQVNTPGIRDGKIRVWLNEELVSSGDNLFLRGNVPKDAALIDQFMDSTFYGGRGKEWEPTIDTSIKFEDFKVWSCDENPHSLKK